MNFTFEHLLAIDAATGMLHLAVSFGEDRLVKASDELGRRHGQLLFRKLEQILESGGIDQSALSGIVVGTGPGSFTGLRVAIAAMKGIAMVRRIPIVGVSLFELLAAQQYDVPDIQMAVIRLTRDEFATMTFAAGQIIPGSLRIGAPREIFTMEMDSPIWLINMPDLQEKEGLPPLVRHFSYDASLLLAQGRLLLEAGISHDLHTLEPVYLQASTAERNWAARQANG